MSRPSQTGLSPLAAWVLTLAATSTMAVSYFDRQAMSVLAPTITKELHIGEAAYGWLGSAFSLSYLLCAPLAGRLIDRVGARDGLLGAVLLWSLVAALHALTPGFEVLFVLRILLGATESPSFPAAAQTVSRALPRTSQEAGFGVLFTGSSVGAVGAAIALPWLEARYQWRMSLVVTALVGLSWVPVWLLVTSRAGARAVLAVRPPAEGPPFSWRDLAKQPAVLRAVVAAVAAAPIIGLVLQWGAKLLDAQHHVKQADVGAYLWLPPLLFDLGAIGFGLVASWQRRRNASDAPPRALFAVAGALMLSVAALGFGQTPWITTVIAAVAIAGGGGVYTLCTADMLGRVPSAHVAAAGSMTASAQSLALIVAFPIIGAVLQYTGSYVPVGLGLAACAVPGLIVWLVWDPRGDVRTVG